MSKTVRFFKPRQLPAVVWNPAKNQALFEFTQEGFYDTDNPKIIDYMERAGYRRLSNQEVRDSDKFIAEQMKKRGEDQTGFVQTVPLPDQDEANPEEFAPINESVEGGSADFVAPEVVPKQGGQAASSVPPPPAGLEDEGDDYPDETMADEVTAPPVKKAKKKAVKKTIKRRTK